MTAEQMTALTNLVLAKYARDLAAAADAATFEHLARRAELWSNSSYGAQARDLVDDARTRRTVTAGLQVTA